MKKYGRRGIIPPRRYPMPMVNAEMYSRRVGISSEQVKGSDNQNRVKRKMIIIINIPNPSPNFSKKGVSPESLFIPRDAFSSSTCADVLANPGSSSIFLRQFVTAWEVVSSIPTGPKTAYTSLSISPIQLRITRE
jgi:hypothetical protein